MAVATQRITLYTTKICPYAHRVEIALAEAQAEYKKYQIDLANKPEWYAPKVNPASKVPALAYGGPDIAPETPSPESEKLAESLILVEFVADLFPQASLLPEDPVLRAKARFFVETISSKLTPTYGAFVLRGESSERVLSGLEAIQDTLPETGKYAVGDQYTIADVAFTPFIARFKFATENELGKFTPEEGRRFVEALQQPKFLKLSAYIGRLLERESFKATFDRDFFKGFLQQRFS
ncbi:hypothetical protein HYDPIDRAFT_168748 [Hydnomerulius pinastri MD-312]|uniref:Unplaced genomic scaffold scaffold_18, whole genome shotgun sequence n=1 Tax=Hydnomerulius pinastri MD-312 TaxID=994086 RepID=A0A0C9WEC5_9AGAM|nr:hypothetical protein HYDPIDRAFT_168748 [Hydnomerulius pinastri MD-312]